VTWQAGLEPLPLVTLEGFLERSGLLHQLADSGPDRLVYVLDEDLLPAQLEQLVSEALAETYGLAFEAPADNRLVCTLTAPTAEAADGGPDGDADGQVEADPEEAAPKEADQVQPTRAGK